MSRTERDRDPSGRPRSEPAAPEPAPPEPDVLALQRASGNAAVARLLQREPVDSLRMRSPQVKAPDLGHSAATQAVLTWFDRVAAEVRTREAGSPVQSVAELVHVASQLPFTKPDGATGKVSEIYKPADVETILRERARTAGITLLEHRKMDDPRGVAAEASAILANLGRIPTEATWGGDAGRITVSLGGSVTAQAKVGGLKLEGEGSSEGVTGKASIKGNVGELEAHGSKEGVGASLKTPGGTKAGIDLGKGVKAEVKWGDLVTVKGSVKPEGEGKVSWSAQITVGTLGNVITPAEVAKVMAGAQETFSKSGAVLLEQRSVEAVAEHGGPLKDAVKEVAEKARKSAGQAKPGWSVGVGAKGDKDGGISGSVTLTWVF